MADFGSYLRELRESKGLGVNELARMAEVSPSLISRVENGVRGIPKIGALNSIAKMLNIPSTEMYFMAGHEVFPEHLEELVPTSIAEKHMTKEELQELAAIKKDDEKQDEIEFQNAINDPDLKRWYMELPQSEEEDLRKLRKMWDIIKMNEK